MIFGSVCSGIEAATQAWEPLGWRPAFFSEIEPFPSAVLKNHHPEITNFGDMTKFKEWPNATIDLLVGGTPCQSFSVAGLRKGLADPRGNLMLTFLAIADRYRPEWLVWENVPGVLSSNGGKDFGALLGGLAELGYGFAYRVLDAQHFGVPQRRRRVFVVANLRDWRRAAAVLFERESLCGDSAPVRGTGRNYSDELERGAPENSSGGISKRLGASGTATGHLDPTQETFIIDEGSSVGFPWQSGLNPIGKLDNISPTLIKNQTIGVAIRTARTGSNGCGITEGLSYTLDGTTGQCVSDFRSIRRLTPTECERLQGFPDGHTLIDYRGKPATDGPRYKAIGNSMAVPVMKWIGERIEMVKKI